MRPWIAAMLLASIVDVPASARRIPSGGVKPTIVLVHGAFAGSSNWDGVVADLRRDGYPVIAAAVPLRSLKGGAAYVASLVASVPGPVVLIGHSYGGQVMSVAATGRPNIRSLVYVAGFAPEIGESPVALGARFPTGTVAETLAPPVRLADSGAALYILQARYWKQFATDVPESEAAIMAATQRPIAQAALAEPAAAAAWHGLPSWFVWGALDHNIPASLHAFMARRATARQSVEVPGASHVVMVSHPHVVSAMIERAAATP